METQRSSPEIFIGTLMVLTSAVAFSSKAIMVKLAYAYPVNAAMLIALRMLFSMPFFVGLAVWAAKTNARVSLDKQDIVTLILLGVLTSYGSMWLNFAGLAYVTAGLERVILFLYPTMVVIFNAVLHQHRITRREIIALIASYLGVILVVWHDLSLPSTSATHTLLGAGLILASAVVYAIYLVFSGKFIPRLGPSLFTAYIMLIASVASGIHFFATQQLTAIEHLPAQVYWLCLLMAVIATVVPSILLSMGIARVGSNKAALVSSIGPVSTIFLAQIFLGETIGVLQLLGTALVLAGVLVISLTQH